MPSFSRVARSGGNHPSRRMQSWSCLQPTVANETGRLSRPAAPCGAISLATSPDCTLQVLNNTMGTHRLHSFGWTMQNMISTSTPQFDVIDGSDKLPSEDRSESESIPLRRSSKPKTASIGEVSAFDDRAQAKLAALSTAKKEADDAKELFLSSKSGDDIEKLHGEWKVSEQNLSRAYSQAVKYTSRISNNQDATEVAERMLFEWMDRFLDSFGVRLERNVKHDAKDSYLNRKKTVRTIHQIMPKLIPGITPSYTSVQPSPTPETMVGSPVRVPPPESKDYINLLRAYSMSKARRKGQQCEVLMRGMMQLVETVTLYYSVCGNDEWMEDRAYDAGMENVIYGDGSQIESWRLWANESVPNSKVFALAIKSHAGSTRELPLICMVVFYPAS